ncbi:hypothetical protein [Thermotalea metallivorans]|uniref:Uncharacterized protein n=1 Tax=Thermotalea metallivorans TaxID=520762 RepID=A0A140L8H9_9FIRM|nr:hypothetical protein [Thermotalea metallivorans]KXG76854.1 hypothetical protein AN619_08460 [Thermotalea metallivorans]
MSTNVNHTVKKIEKLFFYLAIVSFFLLLIFQILHIANDRLIPLNDKSLRKDNIYSTKPVFSAAMLTLQIDGDKDNPSLSVFVNGEEYGRFIHNKIDLIVRDGDVISIKAPHISRPLKIQVLNTTKNLITPRINDALMIKKDWNHLWTIRLDTDF